MAWRELTEADIAATLSQAELEAYRQSADVTTGADPVRDLLMRTSSMVRGFIRGHAKLSSKPYAIPESLVSPSMDYMAFDILKRMPVPVMDDRRVARDSAIALFKDIAVGRFAVETDDEEDQEKNVTAKPTFASPPPTRILD